MLLLTAGNINDISIARALLTDYAWSDHHKLRSDGSGARKVGMLRS